MIASLFSNILNFFIFSMTCKCFFEIKISKKHYIFIQFIIIFIKSIICIQGNPHFNFISSLLTSIILLFFFFKGTLFRKCLLLIFYALSNVICELLALKMNTLFFSKDEVFNTNSISYYSGILLSNLFLILVIKTFSIYIKVFSLPSLPNYFWVIFILPMTTLLMILGISDYYEITGGGILAGEDALKAAKRELKEEVGIETDNLILLGEATDYHFYVYTYLVILAKKPAITLQEKETVAYKWLNKDAFIKKIHQDNFLYFVQERLDAYQDEIESLIKEAK